MQGFESVYRAYFTDVYRYALSLCGDAALADDLTSECFLKAMRAIGSFRGECELRVWLCQILKRLYLDHLRRDGERRAKRQAVSRRLQCRQKGSRAAEKPFWP